MKKHFSLLLLMMNCGMLDNISKEKLDCLTQQLALLSVILPSSSSQEDKDLFTSFAYLSCYDAPHNN